MDDWSTATMTLYTLDGEKKVNSLLAVHCAPARANDAGRRTGAHTNAVASMGEFAHGCQLWILMGTAVSRRQWAGRRLGQRPKRPELSGGVGGDTFARGEGRAERNHDLQAAHGWVAGCLNFESTISAPTLSSDGPCPPLSCPAVHGPPRAPRQVTQAARLQQHSALPGPTSIKQPSSFANFPREAHIKVSHEDQAITAVHI